MISERAKASLNEMVMQGLKGGFVGPTDELLSLIPLADIHPVAEQEIVMLSVASYQFRLMILVYFSRNDATKSHFAGLTRTQSASMNEQTFNDAIAESGNMCCGIFNRELGRVFTHIGMSTPNMIDSECAKHLALLNYGHLQHFSMRLKSGMTFRASLCVTEYQELDFVLAPLAQEESTGELEFF